MRWRSRRSSGGTRSYQRCGSNPGLAVTSPRLPSPLLALASPLATRLSPLAHQSRARSSPTVRRLAASRRTCGCSAARVPSRTLPWRLTPGPGRRRLTSTPQRDSSTRQAHSLTSSRSLLRLRRPRTGASTGRQTRAPLVLAYASIPDRRRLDAAEVRSSESRPAQHVGQPLVSIT